MYGNAEMSWVDRDDSSVEETTSWDLASEDDKSSSYQSGSITSGKDSRTAFYRTTEELESLMGVKEEGSTTTVVPSARSQAQILHLLAGLGYPMIQVNGQRRLGPPPGWTDPAPGPKCEVFVGKIPRDIYEDTIYPVFNRIGEIYEIRLMMDFSGTNRGYGFVMFTKEEDAQRAIRELNNWEIRKGNRIGVVASINNCRLCIGRLPQNIDARIVISKLFEMTDEVSQIGVYRNTSGQVRYALVSYKTHRGAAMARRRLLPDRQNMFKNCEISVDWAQPTLIPSNVIEEMGAPDEKGEIQISRRYMDGCKREREKTTTFRDKNGFLEKSIKDYLRQSVLENSPSHRLEVSRERAAEDRQEDFSGRRKNHAKSRHQIREKVTNVGKGGGIICSFSKEHIKGNDKIWKNVRRAKSEGRRNDKVPSEAQEQIATSTNYASAERNAFDDSHQSCCVMKDRSMRANALAFPEIYPYDDFALPTVLRWDSSDNCFSGQNINSTTTTKTTRANSRILSDRTNDNRVSRDDNDDDDDGSFLGLNFNIEQQMNLNNQSRHEELNNFPMNYIRYDDRLRGGSRLTWKQNTDGYYMRNIESNGGGGGSISFEQPLPQSCYYTSSFASYPLLGVEGQENARRPILSRTRTINDNI